MKLSLICEFTNSRQTSSDMVHWNLYQQHCYNTYCKITNKSMLRMNYALTYTWIILVKCNYKPTQAIIIPRFYDKNNIRRQIAFFWWEWCIFYIWTASYHKRLLSRVGEWYSSERLDVLVARYRFMPVFSNYSK